MDKQKILNALGDHPWRDNLQIYDTVDSTNTLARKLASEGAPSGTVVVADCQTAGRGRMGRSFVSIKGLGLYFSLILRPKLPPDKLLHLTPMVAVAACDAVEEAAGLRPQVKWINDLIINERKLAGILTESSMNFETGKLDYLIIGIGINCQHEPEDFPQGLNAISLKTALGHGVSREELTAALMRSLEKMQAALVGGKGIWMERYREDCLTVGRRVKVICRETETPAFAMGIDENGGLLVRYDDGREDVVSYGEVSVRGEQGYI